MNGFYSRAAMREARQEREAGNPGTPRLVTLADVPADAPYEDAEAVLHVWVDDKFIPYAKWLASRPISVESVAAEETPIPADATCVAGACGGTRVWLVRDGDRWLMLRGIAERQWPAARFCLALPGARDSDGRVLVRRASERLARRRKEKWKRQRRGFICPRSPRGGGEWLTWTTSPAATPRLPRLKLCSVPATPISKGCCWLFRIGRMRSG